jgi:cell division protein FtsX
VVEDVKLRNLLADPEPAVFVRYDDPTWPTTNAILVRTVGPATPGTVGDLRRWLNAYEPHMTVINSVSYRDVVAGSLYTQRMNAELFTALAGLGLALACAGIFSVVSLAVARRRKEIGIRKAMGATPGRIRGRMVGKALIPVAVGGAVGFGVALMGAGLVESLLFGISPLDPGTLVVGVMTLLLASAAAAFFPAWMASRIPARVSLTS